MMKRNILAVVIPVLSMAGAANAAEVYNKDGNKINVYGKAAGLHYFSKYNGENAYAVNGDQIHARLGFKEETQINDQLTDHDRWEHQLNGNNSEDGSDVQNGNKVRLALTGLKFGDTGSFDYGRNYGVVYDTPGYTGMSPEFGGDTAASDQFFSQRNGGLVTYRNANSSGLVEGLNFAVQYLGKNGRDDVRRSNGDGAGGSISYELGSFGVVGAYGAADRTDVQQSPAPRGYGDKAEQWVTGAKYDANNIYPAANYSETRNATRISNGYANKTEDVLLVVQYQFDFGLCPSLAYTKPKGKDAEDTGDVDLVNYFEVDVTYYFNKDMSTYVDHIINQIDSDSKSGVGSDDTAAVGIVYQL